MIRHAPGSSSAWRWLATAGSKARTHSASVAVIWASSGAATVPSLVVDMTKELLQEGPLTYLWVNLEVGTSPESKTVGFTRGLVAFGLDEVEAPDSPEAPGPLRGRLEALSVYLLEKGPVIKHGDTVRRNLVFLTLVTSREAIPAV